MKNDPIRDLRRAKLRALVEAEGGPTRFAGLYDLEQSYVSQLLKGHSPFGEKAARNLEVKLKKPRMWLDTAEVEGVKESAAPYAQDPQIAALIDDFEALPEGWRYHIARKTKDLRQIADKLPPFIRDSMRAIPDEARYWEWERELERFVKQQQGIVEGDDGYIGQDRRTTVTHLPPDEERRKEWKLVNGPAEEARRKKK